MSKQPGDKYLTPEAQARLEILEDLPAAAGESAAAACPPDEED